MKEALLTRKVSVFYGQNKALHEVSLEFPPSGSRPSSGLPAPANPPFCAVLTA